MKKIFVLLLLFHNSCIQAQKKPVQERFDIVSFQPVGGWTRSSINETLSFSKEDASGNYCVITLCKSVEASADAQINFDHSWKAMAVNNLGAGNVTMQPPSSDNGWQTYMGSGPFEKDGLKGAVILVTSSKNKRMVNILILTNTEKFQKEVEAFLASVTMKEIASGNSNATVPTSTDAPSTAKEKPELWQFRRTSPIYTNMDGSVEKAPVVYTDYIVIYPNGDYLQNPPYQGLNGLNKSTATDSWGKFTMKGNKGLFKNKYDEMPVTKKSTTHMERDGYVAGIYKCLPVDGLRIEGAYTHVSPDWGKDAQLNYLSNPGCQFVIYFKKDGTFDDRGVFSSSAGGCTNCNCQGGTGTYRIENFTITFNYNDGRVVQRLFAAPPTRNPATYNETYYIGNTAYYRKK